MKIWCCCIRLNADLYIFDMKFWVLKIFFIGNKWETMGSTMLKSFDLFLFVMMKVLCRINHFHNIIVHVALNSTAIWVKYEIIFLFYLMFWAFRILAGIIKAKLCTYIDYLNFQWIRILYIDITLLSFRYSNKLLCLPKCIFIQSKILTVSVFSCI